MVFGDTDNFDRLKILELCDLDVFYADCDDGEVQQSRAHVGFLSLMGFKQSRNESGQIIPIIILRKY